MMQTNKNTAVAENKKDANFRESHRTLQGKIETSKNLKCVRAGSRRIDGILPAVYKRFEEGLMSNSSSSSSSGIGFVGLLTILFIALKLLGYITWSWWWVLSPLWISGLVGIIFLIGFVYFLIIREG